MWRNIIGQTILQLTILIVLLFKVGYLFDISYKNEDPFYLLDEPTDKLRAYTIVFQTFVLMQVFNMINSRKLGECNVLRDFFGNCYFSLILIFILGIQMLFV